MIRALAWLFALCAVSACASEVELAKTQVTISIDTRSELLRERLDGVRITVTRAKGPDDNPLKSWSTSQSATILESAFAQWPIDIPAIPEKQDDAAHFEVVVEALEGKQVLAQMRGITRFVVGQRRRFTLWLEPCEGELGQLCRNDEDCHGTQCEACGRSGSCAPISITDPETLPKLGETRTVDDRVDAGRGGPDGATDARGEATCKPEGALRCAGTQGPKRETCEDGTWVAAESCEVEESCIAGPAGGTCKGPCEDVVCDENASCTVVEGGARCVCKPDYVQDGESCRFDDACAALKCGTNAECAVVGDMRECRCRPGFVAAGTACENIDECAATPSPCDTNATCTDTAGSFACTCKTGFSQSGTQCLNVDDCASNPCQHGGKCSDGVGGPVCDCTGSGHSGKLCETNVDDCAPKPCKNGGKCADEADGFTCDCSGTGYMGADCSSNVDDCSTNPCLHGGRCSDGVGSSSCNCAGTGYTGDRCQTNVNDCSPNPCLNGGLCSDGVDAYTCSCAGTGFSGDRCQTNVNDCSPNPCLNGGRCSDGVDAHTCSCAGTGFSGTRCETNVNDCSPNPCMNGGSCTDRTNDFSCSCAVGWSGTRCETRSCGNGRVDLGEQCDPASSPDAKWTCDSVCRPATQYTNCVTGPSCVGSGVGCTPTGYCSLVPCNTTSDCPGVSGANVSCRVDFRQCVVNCTRTSDCAPGTFCDPSNGICAAVLLGGCSEDGFACPPGAVCSGGNCLAQ